MDSLTARSIVRRTTHLQKSAIAGVCVGSIIGFCLLLFCLYPVVVRAINKRRTRRHAAPRPDDAEAGAASPAPAMAESHSVGGHRRLSSRDSFAPRADLRTMESAERHSSKDLTLGSFDGHDDSPVVPAAGLQDMADSPESDTATRQDGSPPEYQLRGHSASYYITDERFEPTAAAVETVAASPRFYRFSSKDSSSSFLGSLIRRARSSRGSSSTPSTVVAAGLSPTQDADHHLASQTITESPVELSPQQSALGGPAGMEFASPVQVEAMFASSAPVQNMPAPGTVSLMQVQMVATTDDEQIWRTQQQLLQMESRPQLAPNHTNPVEPVHATPEIDEPQSPEPPAKSEPLSPPEEASSHNQVTWPPPHIPIIEGDDGGDTDMPEASPAQQNYYNTPIHHHRHTNSQDMYYTDPSELSTPNHPAPSPSGPSNLDTPDTRITDQSMSPRSDVSQDIRHSASPNPTYSPLLALRCPECERVFDQPHKLNHHKRYHERPHICTYQGCGKKFGTKTHLDRHVNDKHIKTKKYYCIDASCPYSKQGGKSFPRKDNWRRHMTKIHGQKDLEDPDAVDEPMGGMM